VFQSKLIKRCSIKTGVCRIQNTPAKRGQFEVFLNTLIQNEPFGLVVLGDIGQRNILLFG